jgi:uncharacterized membrane protein (UPF0127 family)
MKAVAKVLAASLLLLLAGCGGFSDAGSNQGAPPETSGADCAAETAGDETTREAARGLRTVTIATSGGEKVEVRVEVAESSLAQTIGLRWRRNLPEDRGMLFVYDEEREMEFTMQDTVIPLSIAFIDAEGRIVTILDMEPLEKGPYLPGEPAQYALEVNQGFYDECGVEVGDRAELPE